MFRFAQDQHSVRDTNGKQVPRVKKEGKVQDGWGGGGNMSIPPNCK
jgi:hypothetical protein